MSRWDSLEPMITMPRKKFFQVTLIAGLIGTGTMFATSLAIGLMSGCFH